MPIVYLTRRERFNAAHKLFKPEWTEEKNLEVFGKCSNPNWHGHNYTLFVTVKGEPDPETGFVINLKTLGKIVREKITDKLDHKNINLDVDFTRDIMPTTENLAIAIWRQLEPHVNNLKCNLHCIKICETENNFVEYYGE